jgi:hypothetical protein
MENLFYKLILILKIKKIDPKILLFQQKQIIQI